MAPDLKPKKRGAPFGRANGSWRHGKYSHAVRAQRQAEAEAEARAAAEWVRQHPHRTLDYEPIIRELERLRADREQEEYWSLLTKH